MLNRFINWIIILLIEAKIHLYSNDTRNNADAFEF